MIVDASKGDRGKLIDATTGAVLMNCCWADTDTGDYVQYVLDKDGHMQTNEEGTEVLKVKKRASNQLVFLREQADAPA